jgi:hypothetical protein
MKVQLAPGKTENVIETVQSKVISVGKSVTTIENWEIILF